MQSHFPTATMITISPLSPENFEAVVALKVSDDQSSFVAPNVLSIAQSKTWDYLVPGVIEKDGTAIGFVLYGKDPESRRVYIVRLMIDRAYQRNGHGAAALGLLLVKLGEAYACKEIHVSVVPGNLGSERLFHSLGFISTGEVDEDGEVVLRRSI
jgi:diamine N-acetyltransferase